MQSIYFKKISLLLLLINNEKIIKINTRFLRF